MSHQVLVYTGPHWNFSFFLVRFYNWSWPWEKIYWPQANWDSINFMSSNGAKHWLHLNSLGSVSLHDLSVTGLRYKLFLSQWNMATSLVMGMSQNTGKIHVNLLLKKKKFSKFHHSETLTHILRSSHAIYGSASLSDEISYCKTSWTLTVMRFGVRGKQSLWNLTGILAAMLPKCLSNFIVMVTFKYTILRLQDLQDTTMKCLIWYW